MEQISERSVGVDVGKRELVVCVRCSNGITDPPAAFSNSSIGLEKLIVHLRENNISNDDPILFESTGPYHWQAARTLADKGYFAKVANPLYTKQIARFSIRKRKTDKVDAANLAFLASQGYGYQFVETEEMVKRKALIRHYWKLRGVATNFWVHERYLKEYRGVKTESVSDLIVEQCKIIKKRIINEWSKGNGVKYLDSIPGVTPFLAANILSEIMPLTRFQRIDQLVAFAGLDPSVKQTGGKPGRNGAISKRGSTTLRETLWLAAFGSFQREPMKSLYLKYKERGLHHNTILCVLGRKILRIAVALLKKRRMFDPKFLSVDKST